MCDTYIHVVNASTSYSQFIMNKKNIEKNYHMMDLLEWRGSKIHWVNIRMCRDKQSLPLQTGLHQDFTVFTESLVDSFCYRVFLMYNLYLIVNDRFFFLSFAKLR